MKILRNNIFRLFLVVFLGVATSCEITDLGVEDSPNALTPSSADLELYLNSVQLSFGTLWQQGNEFAMEPVRMLHMFGPTYQSAYVPQSFDGFWSTAYATVLQDISAAEAIAIEKELPNHEAILKIFKAYTYMILVDMFGDVPYTEANLGSDDLAPAADDDATIYADMITELNEAVTLINEGSTFVPETDLYYGGDMEGWMRLAETLKMKAYLNTGNATGFAQVLTDGNYINGPGWDFEFSYGSNLANPDSRHPQYSNNYDNGGNDYMANQYMDRFLSTNDPRIRYYFYRQETGGTTDVNERPCITQTAPAWYAGEVFCDIGNGYWGRDHGNDDGIPPDDLLRTLWGIYPIGGEFDDDQDDPGEQGFGAGGVGINPFMLSSFVDFMRAEAALTLGTGEDARALLSSAMDASWNKVSGFPAAIGYDMSGFASVPAAGDWTTYRDDVLTNSYDTAADDDERLSIVAVEYYKALWGNGYEAYNLYRRTGYPDDMQPLLKSNPADQFINTHFYPANAVNRNSSLSQKDLGDLVFWASELNLK